MDDFERGAREMQRVAAEAMDKLALKAIGAMSECSKGIDKGDMWSRLREVRDCYTSAALIIRSISIEDAINAVVGDER